MEVVTGMEYQILDKKMCGQKNTLCCGSYRYWMLNAVAPGDPKSCSHAHYPLIFLSSHIFVYSLLTSRNSSWLK